ncbi:MAG: hypothetical protein ACLQMO_15780 [Acidobacteriaceae bacterium]
MLGPSLEILLCGIVCLLALALLLRVATAARRLRNGSEVLLQRSERGRRAQPKWLTSPLFLFFLVLVWVGLGARTAIAGRDWYRDERSASHQKEVFLDLTIPHVSPERIYTVVAKFQVDGRAYVSSSPLHIQFGQQKPVYRVVLYYDSRNPTRNAWTQFQRPRPQVLDRVLAYAAGFLALTAGWIELIETEWIRRRLQSASPGRDAER